MPPRRIVTRTRPTASGGKGSNNEQGHQAHTPPLRINEERNEYDDEDYEESEDEDTQGMEMPVNPMEQFVELLRQNLQQQRPPQQPQQAMDNVFKSFKSVKPPELHGVADPVQARAWLKEVEKTFERIGTEEAHKTNFATYLLKGEMQRKILELKQENMSVAEYEAKFTELSKFVPQPVGTEEQKAERFQQGLKQWIQNKLAILEITDYATLVQKATIAETGSEMSQKMKQTKKQKFDGRSRSVGGESFPSKFVRGTASQPNRSTGFGGSENVSVARSGNQTGMSYHSQPRPPLPECKSCGKRYSGQCMQKPVTCFKCGKVGHYATACNQEVAKCFQCRNTGHMKKDCLTAAPTSSRGSVATSNRVLTARTSNMTVKNAVRSTNVIAGTLLLNSNPANVLFDSRATKCFVSKEFAEKLNLKVEPLKESLQVEIDNKEFIPVNQVYANCNLELGGVRYLVDLIPFLLGEFDVILGMDCLSRNHAQINCEGKKVKLKTPSGKIIIIKGQRQTKKFLTMVQTKRLLRQGCGAYLAHVVDTKRETPEIHTIPVVNEFEDVFPKDLPGLPPDREIEFAIDLATGTTPVSKAPYRLAPVEMKELADQL
ncbi:uncharacterized protein LOC141660418 [Apium graveolens]|uniref:uncharacterized protein LOC141660418 n=1 Tax=Apium graveolens TaxID=4045 RepID=UPI003D7B8A21